MNFSTKKKNLVVKLTSLDKKNIVNKSMAIFCYFEVFIAKIVQVVIMLAYLDNENRVNLQFLFY